MIENLDASSYSPGGLIKVTNGHDIYRSTDTHSCPDGWKVWAPRSRSDWTAALDASGFSGLNSPHFIIDVTRPSNGCGGCTGVAMNSATAGNGWTTTDGADWWMRDANYNEPNGDYTANCYLHIYNYDEDDVQFNDGNPAQQVLIEANNPPQARKFAEQRYGGICRSANQV